MTSLTEKKSRKMLQVQISTGREIEIQEGVSVTLPTYIDAINRLNKNAYNYGVVYLPKDSDYDAFVGCDGQE